MRECFEVAGRQKGRPHCNLHGMVPELPIALLACARIGAPHTVIFGGFSAQSLIDRINDCGAVAVITQDASYRRGAEVKLKEAVDQALPSCPTVKNGLVYRRTGHEVKMQPGRDHWWHEADGNRIGSVPGRAAGLRASFVLALHSGTTGKPKGILHTTGGYAVGTYITSKWFSDLREEDTFWCTADIGWVTGHSYVVYGPLQNGATILMYEGAPTWPEPDRFWKIIEKYQVNIFYTAQLPSVLLCDWASNGRKARDEIAATAGQCGRAD